MAGNVYKVNIVLDYLKGISHWESLIGVPSTNPYFLVCNICKESGFSDTF